jgi:GR25 family glycosyltransferase involved in LPS biosynthesis
MRTLFRKNLFTIESAYIITIEGNASSEKYSTQCQESCQLFKMPYKVWPAYDGTTPGNNIAIPIHMRADSIMNMLKVTDHYLTRSELACALSHISLWVHCAVIDEPIVILEHDAIMLRKFEIMHAYNTIVYLGGSEWKIEKQPMIPIPPYASNGPNTNFICRAHAYAIDPAMAKNLLAYVIQHGIDAPLDMIMRADLFNITHQGLYAYDSGNRLDTTITGRSQEDRNSRRNSNLEW